MPICGSVQGMGGREGGRWGLGQARENDSM